MTAPITPIRIAELTADDLDAVLEIERASFERPWSRKQFARELASEVSRTLVAWSIDEPGRCLGYVCRWFVAGEVEIHDLAIHPERRRQGIAHRLLKEVCEEAERLGAGRVTLEVRDDNVAALQLYERLGFVEVGRRRSYYGQGRDGVLMTLTIGAGTT